MAAVWVVSFSYSLSSWSVDTVSKGRCLLQGSSARVFLLPGFAWGGAAPVVSTMRMTFSVPSPLLGQIMLRTVC